MSGGFYLFRIMLYPASLVWWFVIVSSSGRPFWFELLLPQSRICECMMIFLKMKSQTFCSCIQLLDGPLLSTVSRILQNARARYLVWMNVAGKEVAKAPKNNLVPEASARIPRGPGNRQVGWLQRPQDRARPLAQPHNERVMTSN